MKQVVGRRYRKVLEQGGPFPDLIVIDGGKGQLNAAYEALEEIGLANLIAIGLAKKEELVFVARQRSADRASTRTARRCGCCSASATKRTASPSPSIASSAPGATCAPSSTRCRASARAAASAADAVRQPHRRPPRHPRGADARRRRQGQPDAIIELLRSHELRREPRRASSTDVSAGFPAPRLRRHRRYLLATLASGRPRPRRQLLIAFVILIASLTFHEAAHAWTANRLGDPTARHARPAVAQSGVHVDVIGTIVFPLIAMVTGVPLIGWAKPVPVDMRNLRSSAARFRHRRAGRSGQQSDPRRRRARCSSTSCTTEADGASATSWSPRRAGPVRGRQRAAGRLQHDSDPAARRRQRADRHPAGVAGARGRPSCGRGGSCCCMR